MIATGALDHCNQLANNEFKRLQEVIHKGPFKQKRIKDFLLGLGEYLITREV